MDVELPGDGFAVIDFETTGFAALKADRVVEIDANAEGSVEDLFSTEDFAGYVLDEPGKTYASSNSA
jgi:hypothetical protein